MKYTIDATDKKLGRVASEAAGILLGKKSTGFKKNTTANVLVEIVNISQLKISEKKRENKSYVSYSGYPGGLKKTTLKEFIVKHGVGEALRQAVYRMLPANKLRTKRLKRLLIK